MSQPQPSLSGHWYSVSGLTRERTWVWMMITGQGPRLGYMVPGRGGARYVVRGPRGEEERVPRHATPSLFQPIAERPWPDPLPAPAVLQPDLEPLPDPSRRRKAHLAPAGHPPLPTAIAYGPPGHIGLEECEARLLRALMTDRALPDTDRAKLGVRANWPETSYGPGDYPPGISLRWRPFPEDVQDYITAMGWFAALSKTERELVRLRAAGLSFARIGERLVPKGRGGSDELARQHYIQALTRALVIANDGHPPLG